MREGPILLILEMHDLMIFTKNAHPAYARRAQHKKTPRKFRTVISFTDLMTKMTKRSIEI